MNDEKLPARERYDDLAKQIDREDGLINHRTTWLILAETLLFAGIATVVAKAADMFHEHHLLLAALMCLGSAGLLVLSAVVANRSKLAVLAAHQQLLYLQGEWEQCSYLHDHYIQPFGGPLQHAAGVDYPVSIASAFEAASRLGVVVLLVSSLGLVATWCVAWMEQTVRHGVALSRLVNLALTAGGLVTGVACGVVAAGIFGPKTPAENVARASSKLRPLDDSGRYQSQDSPRRAQDGDDA